MLHRKESEMADSDKQIMDEIRKSSTELNGLFSKAANNGIIEKFHTRPEAEDKQTDNNQNDLKQVFIIVSLEETCSHSENRGFIYCEGRHTMAEAEAALKSYSGQRGFFYIIPAFKLQKESNNG